MMAMTVLAPSSWPDLARPSTTFLPARAKDLDSRYTAGYDDERRI